MCLKPVGRFDLPIFDLCFYHLCTCCGFRKCLNQPCYSSKGWPSDAAVGGRHGARRRIWGWETRTVRHQSYSFTVRNRCALVRSSAPVRQRLSRGNRGRRLAPRKEYWAPADGSAAPRAPPPPVAAPPARRLHNRSSQRRGSVARRLRPGTGGGEGGGQPTRGDRGRRVACSQAQVEGRWGSC